MEIFKECLAVAHDNLPCSMGLIQNLDAPTFPRHILGVSSQEDGWHNKEPATGKMVPHSSISSRRRAEG
jgi:hypothetical protein